MQASDARDGLVEFWRTTWSAWRSGALASISAAYAKAAEGEFDRFIETCPDVSAKVEEFFLLHIPRSQEFLIAHLHSKNRLDMVMTSQRLWMFDLESNQLIGFELADVAKLSSTIRWNSVRVVVRLGDGSERVFRKMVAAPSDKALDLVFERIRSSDGWSNNLNAPAETALPRLPPQESPRVPACPRPLSDEFYEAGRVGERWREFKEMALRTTVEEFSILRLHIFGKGRERWWCQIGPCEIKLFPMTGDAKRLPVAVPWSCATQNKIDELPASQLKRWSVGTLGKFEITPSLAALLDQWKSLAAEEQRAVRFTHALNGTWAVKSADGMETQYDSFDSIRSAVLDRRIGPDDQAALVRDPKGNAIPNPQWKSVSAGLAKTSFGVRRLFEPEWAYTMLLSAVAARLGVVIAIAICAVVSLKSEAIGVSFWLAFTSSLWCLPWLSRMWNETLAPTVWIGGGCATAFTISRYVPVWSCLPTAIVIQLPATLVGALFGFFPGMILGTVIGLWQSNDERVHSVSESRRPIVMRGIVIPFFCLVVLSMVAGFGFPYLMSFVSARLASHHTVPQQRPCGRERALIAQLGNLERLPGSLRRIP